jgi:hypothetical protein
MALTKCEDCGHDVSTSATACPNCGRPLDASPAATRQTVAPAPTPVASPQPANAKRNWFRRHPILTFLLALALIGAVSAGASNGKSNNSPGSNASSNNPSAPSTSAVPQSEKDARDWIKNLGLDSGRVSANVAIVQIELGLAIKHPTATTVDKLAQEAQQAHDNLDGIRQDFASTNEDNGALGNAELLAFSGANDLKNSMGALVTYTGSPNAATLASFTTQYRKARGEWNYGVRTIWRLAHKKRPPTV